IGKWHMGGEIDDPQRGFDHWISFKGQGTYWPDGHGTTRVVPQTSYEGLNVNGRRVPQHGYITDELTDYALNWLKSLPKEQPFFLYVSHKAVHADFVPADRHRGRYDDEPLPIRIPSVQELEDGGLPIWVRNQRNSRHGADFGYNLAEFDPAVYYRRYCESLLAVDDSVGRLLNHLEQSGQLQNTIFVYMGDNGFQFGDHGLIDKRTAYEASARVPLLFFAPGRIPGNRRIQELVANIDIAPTLLVAAGAPGGPQMDGQSFWNIITASSTDAIKPIRSHLLYEYYWERNYPHTPTVHAVITKDWKYVRCHGLWDVDELYDLAGDPSELRNLIHDPQQQERVEALNGALWQILSVSHGLELPLLEDRGNTYPLRLHGKSPQAPFPPQFIVPEGQRR
ncbi:MAG: sulfatase-like hydrolase/transferase, partial [Planctomycetaceae bacterium]|nr:sulfatase-like hydrolase/transferase [Planctomycetaceae bacterium]